MGLYRYNNRETYFVHIPRTGGRYLHQLFRSAGAEQAYTTKDKLVLGREIRHLHYPLYECKLKTENATHITVVRDPLDRFKSVMTQKAIRDSVDYNELIKTKKDWERFLLIGQEIDEFKTNWLRPQNQFVSRKTFIWKYEDGFGTEFIDWLNRMTGIGAQLEDKSYTLLPSEQSDKEVAELSDQICEWAKEFYADDYKRFGYDASS